jgi:two-component system, OmpR family, phosphate regulon sensor histidine kinase PhoR
VGKRGVEREAEIARLLLHAARQLGETLEPERVYDRFRELLAELVPHDGVVVSSYDEVDGLIRCDYAWVEGNRVDSSSLPALALNREGGGMQSRVIVTGEPLLANDVAERVEQGQGTYYNVDREGNVRRIPEAGPAATTAAMMVPVKHEGQVVGVVQLMTDHGQYAPEDLELVEGLVGQMAAAVRNARLQKERSRLEAAEAAARARAAEREQAARVLEVVGDGIFLVDRHGSVVLWNHAAELVTGLGGEAVCGRPVADVFPGWDVLAQRIPVADEEAAARSVTLPVEVDGRDLWLSFVAVQSADGLVYAFRDLTSERRLDDEKRDFIATISHELRTPMAAVYGAAQTLLRRDIELRPEQARELLEMIATQASRLSQVTEEILLTTRLDRDEVRVEREPVDVVELARTTVLTMTPQLPQSLRIELEVEPDVPPASGDRDRIQQVLLNLLDNAVKYGGSDVGVRVEGAPDFVRIAVADSGPGIPHLEQQWIFEKFYRSDPQLSRAPGGTGLGLYISRELARRMGGRLDVRSQPGAGATFVFELPRA